MYVTTEFTEAAASGFYYCPMFSVARYDQAIAGAPNAAHSSFDGP